MKKSIKTKVLSLVASFAMVLSLLVLPIGVHAEGEAVSTGQSNEVMTESVVKGETKNYTTLEEALTDVDNKELTLLKNITMTGKPQIKHNVVLDLNGFTINCESNSINIIENGSLTVKDSQDIGIIKGKWPVFVKNNGSFTLENGTINGLWYAICGNGSADFQGDKGTTINIKGGKVYQNDPNDPHCAAIYHPQKGTINISGGEIIGSVGIQLCSGGLTTVNMSGGIVRGTGEDLVLSKSEPDGCLGDGAAISALDRNYPGGAPYVNITGGTYISDNSKSIMAYSVVKVDGQYERKEWIDAKNHVKISGGTYSSDVTKYIPDGYKVYGQADGTYKVAPKANSLEIDCDFAELEVGQTLQLNTVIGPDGTLEDVVWSSSDNKVATIDENGCVNSLTPGKAIITAKAGDVSDICEITVYEVEEPTLPKEDIQVNEEAKEVIGNTTTTIVDAVKKDEEVKNVEFVDENAKEALKNAQVVTTEVATKQLTEDKVEKTIVTAIDNKVKEINKTNKTEGEVVQYLDLSVLLNADGETVGHITELEDKIEFTVPVPKDLQKDGVNFYVVRVHDGQVERLEDCVYDAKTGIVTFSTDKFSTYALVSEVKASSDVVVTPEKPKPTDKEDKPVDTNKPTEKEETVKTDDENNMTLYASFAGLALVGVAILVLTKKREEFMK